MKTIEGHKSFPMIAWTTVICFAVFTYYLTVNLQNDLDHLNTKVQAMEDVVNSNSAMEL